MYRVGALTSPNSCDPTLPDVISSASSLGPTGYLHIPAFRLPGSVITYNVVVRYGYPNKTPASPSPCTPVWLWRADAVFTRSAGQAHLLFARFIVISIYQLSHTSAIVVSPLRLPLAYGTSTIYWHLILLIQLLLSGLTVHQQARPRGWVHAGTKPIPFYLLPAGCRFAAPAGK